jgi:hypothetical protein
MTAGSASPAHPFQNPSMLRRADTGRRKTSRPERCKPIASGAGIIEEITFINELNEWNELELA